jgi:hypothetical protein
MIYRLDPVIDEDGIGGVDACPQLARFFWGASFFIGIEPAILVVYT